MTPADTAELRRVAHLVADAGIAADDALRRDDGEALRLAVEALEQHVARLRAAIGAEKT